MDGLSNKLAENIRRLRAEIGEAAIRAGREPSGVRLMAVTKTQPAALVNEAIEAGIDLLGENRAQELCARYGDYRKEGVEIHFIGRLQTNKVKLVAERAVMVQSVDSLKLAAELSKHAERLKKELEVLIEVNVGGEESKTGVTPEGAEELARGIARLPGLRLRGLMAIPPVWNSAAQNEPFFARMHQMLVDIREKNIDNVSMEILSMGMSGDFAAAIRHGSTLVRLGTALFGGRS